MNRFWIVIGFIVAFVIQGALLFWMIGDRALLLARGTEVRLAVVPVDPRDFLRGDYVILSYDLSMLDAHELAGDDTFDWGDTIYVTVEKKPDGDTWQATAITHAPPAGKLALKGTVDTMTDDSDRQPEGAPPCPDCKKYNVVYGLEQFFVPEGKGRELETLRNDQKLQVDVAVASNGRAALKRLLVDGQPTYEDPLF
jgi:uncharacterized membrane-anchored protein